MDESRAFSVAVVGRVVVCAAGGQLAVSHVRTLARAFDQLGAGPLATFTFVQSTRPGAADDARKELAALSHRVKDRDVGSAVVIDGAGFQSSIVRGIVSGVTLLAGGHIKVFADVDAGAVWLEGLAARRALAGFDRAAVEAAAVSLAARQRAL